MVPTASNKEPLIQLPDVYLSLRHYVWLSLRLTASLNPMGWFLVLATTWYSLVEMLRKYPLQKLWSSRGGSWPIIMVAFSAVGLPLYLVYTSWKQYRNTPFLQHPTNYSLFDDHLQIRSAVKSSSVQWNAIIKAQKLSSWLFLYTANGTGYFLDTRQVAAPAAAGDVYALLLAHAIPLK